MTAAPDRGAMPPPDSFSAAGRGPELPGFMIGLISRTICNMIMKNDGGMIP